MGPKIDLKNDTYLQIKENVLYFSHFEGLTVVMHVFQVREVSLFKHLSETKVQSMMYESSIKMI